jgi:hypothetical protein
MIAAASSAALIRSFVWVFICESPRSHESLYASSPPAQVFLFLWRSGLFQWRVAALSVIVGHAKSRKSHSRGEPEVLVDEGGEDGDDPIGCPGNSAGSNGAQTPPGCRGPRGPSPRPKRPCPRSNLRRQGHGHGAGPTHRPPRNPSTPRRRWKGEGLSPNARRVPHSARPRLRCPGRGASMVSQWC